MRLQSAIVIYAGPFLDVGQRSRAATLPTAPAAPLPRGQHRSRSKSSVLHSALAAPSAAVTPAGPPPRSIGSDFFVPVQGRFYHWRMSRFRRIPADCANDLSSTRSPLLLNCKVPAPVDLAKPWTSPDPRPQSAQKPFPPVLLLSPSCSVLSLPWTSRPCLAAHTA